MKKQRQQRMVAISAESGDEFQSLRAEWRLLKEVYKIYEKEARKARYSPRSAKIAQHAFWALRRKLTVKLDEAGVEWRERLGLPDKADPGRSKSLARYLIEEEKKPGTKGPRMEEILRPTYTEYRR